MSADPNSADRWKPRLSVDGKIFCSPACGFKCTKAQHDEAQVLAKKLAKRLGKGWKADVWENSGRWHWAAKHKTEPVQVHHGRDAQCRSWEHIEGTHEYRVYLNTNPQFLASHVDPKTAVLEALQALDEHIEALRATHYAVIRPWQP